MYVYKISNTINNKVYIGQSIRPIEQRFKRHINDALNNILDTHFARAIRKYGADKFYIELIDTATNQEELTEKEQQWIRYYRSNNPKYGYNETDAKYKSGGNTYKNKTAQELKEIADKISKTKIGGLNNNARKIKCLNIKTNEEIVFDSLSLCQKYFKESTHRFITTRVNYQTRSLYKGEWAISYYENDYITFLENVAMRDISLSVYNIDNGEINFFPSIRKMCRDLHLDKDIVSKLLDNDNVAMINKYIISVSN